MRPGTSHRLRKDIQDSRINPYPGCSRDPKECECYPDECDHYRECVAAEVEEEKRSEGVEPK